MGQCVEEALEQERTVEDVWDCAPWEAGRLGTVSEVKKPCRVLEPRPDAEGEWAKVKPEKGSFSRQLLSASWTRSPSSGLSSAAAMLSLRLLLEKARIRPW